MPRWKDELISSDNSLASSFSWSLSILIGMLLGPTALSSFRLLIISSISLVVVGVRKKEFPFGVFR